MLDVDDTDQLFERRDRVVQVNGGDRRRNVTVTPSIEKLGNLVSRSANREPMSLSRQDWRVEIGHRVARDHRLYQINELAQPVATFRAQRDRRARAEDLFR